MRPAVLVAAIRCNPDHTPMGDPAGAGLEYRAVEPVEPARSKPRATSPAWMAAVQRMPLSWVPAGADNG